MPWPPPQTLQIKKFINSISIFTCKCVILGVICVFLGVILQNFPGGVTPDPSRMVVLKLICDVTRLRQNSPPRKFSAYATAHTTVAVGAPLKEKCLYHRRSPGHMRKKRLLP